MDHFILSSQMTEISFNESLLYFCKEGIQNMSTNQTKYFLGRNVHQSLAGVRRINNKLLFKKMQF